MVSIIAKDKIPHLKNGENCYLQYISNAGEICYKSAKMEICYKLSNGITNPYKVLLNGKSAYCKDSRPVDDSDDLELIINFIGRVLGIKMAEEYRHINIDFVPDSLISIDVADNVSQFIPMSVMRNKIANRVKDKSLMIEPWMNRLQHILERKAFPNNPMAFESLAIAYEEVEDVINSVIFILDNTPNIAQSAKDDYLNMVFLDVLTGQVDRTMDNFGLIYDSGTDEYTFAPLFDNATLEKPYSQTGYCLVNGVFCKREDVIKVLKNRFNFKKTHYPQLDSLKGKIINPCKAILPDKQFSIIMKRLDIITDI